jgi:prefoldin alpha subunit
MATKNKDEEARELLFKLKYLENQMAAVQGQLSVLDRGLLEIASTKTALGSLKKITKESSSLLPLGSGIFAKGMLLKQDKVLMDVGGGAIVEKDITQAEEVLSSREKDIQNNLTNYQQALVTLEKQYNELADKARSLNG